MQVSLNPAARDLKKVNGDERYTPYQKAFPVDAVSELVWPNVLGGEERDWVPQSEGVHFLGGKPITQFWLTVFQENKTNPTL